MRHCVTSDIVYIISRESLSGGYAKNEKMVKKNYMVKIGLDRIGGRGNTGDRAHSEVKLTTATS